MIICFPIQKDDGLDSLLDERFGRAAFYLFLETTNQELTIEQNQYLNDAHGVGIKIASNVVNKGCNVVIGPQPGPKAMDILRQANVTFIQATGGSVKQALDTHGKTADINE